MFNSLTFSYRVPYKLKPFSYCRLLNDRVRSASVTLDTNSGTRYFDDFTREAIHLIPEMTYYKKSEFIYCLKCIPYIRRWKNWLSSTENKFKRKFTCYPSYNNKYTSELHLMNFEDIEIIKKHLIISLTSLITDLHYMEYKNYYQVDKAEYLIREQNKVKNKLKNLLGQEKYSQLMSKEEMTKYLKQNINGTITK